MENDMTEMCKTVEGWGKPANSKKEHYFIGMKSLCMRWALFSSTLRKEPSETFLVCEECMKGFQRQKESRDEV